MVADPSDIIWVRLWTFLTNRESLKSRCCCWYEASLSSLRNQETTTTERANLHSENENTIQHWIHINYDKTSRRYLVHGAASLLQPVDQIIKTPANTRKRLMIWWFSQLLTEMFSCLSLSLKKKKSNNIRHTVRFTPTLIEALNRWFMFLMVNQETENLKHPCSHRTKPAIRPHSNNQMNFRKSV